jgi:DNA-directed RNA polymerase subunit M/transcription elongation factor TFIIS
MSTRKRTSKKGKSSKPTEEELKQRLEKEEEIRQRVRETLNEILEQNEVATEIEAELFAHVGEKIESSLAGGLLQNRKARMLYHHILHALVLNLNPESSIKNLALRGKVVSRTISAAELVRSSPTDWFPEKWDAVKKKKKAEETFLYERKIVAKSTAYTCGKCHHKETSYEELQTRSADEPMTLFFTCLHCSHRWRMG